MKTFATIDDLQELWRPFKNIDEANRAESLLEVVSDSLREEAKRVGKDLDKMVEESPSFCHCG